MMSIRSLLDRWSAMDQSERSFWKQAALFLGLEYALLGVPILILYYTAMMT